MQPDMTLRHVRISVYDYGVRNLAQCAQKAAPRSRTSHLGRNHSSSHTGDGTACRTSTPRVSTMCINVYIYISIHMMVVESPIYKRAHTHTRICQSHCKTAYTSTPPIHSFIIIVFPERSRNCFANRYDSHLHTVRSHHAHDWLLSENNMRATMPLCVCVCV